MIELLRNIPGPQFLGIFSVLVIAGTLVGRFLINSGQSGLRMPDPSAYSPTAVASLRGGWELVLKTTIFGLWQRGTIEMSGPADSHILRRAEGIGPPSERVEMAVWNFLKTEHKTDDFFKDPTLKSFVETHVRQLQQEFERKGLMKSSDQRRNAWLIFMAVLAVVEGTGLVKLLLGISNNRPVGFLIALLGIALVAIPIALKPSSKLTPLGKAFLTRLEEHFAWLKEAVKGREKPGVDPAYAFAIFGTTVLAGTLLYSSFSEAFPGKTPGGCGGSSCGGSSCSGGGCSGGGGGCGGCGGGD